MYRSYKLPYNLRYVWPNYYQYLNILYLPNQPKFTIEIKFISNFLLQYNYNVVTPRQTTKRVCKFEHEFLLTYLTA